MIVAAIVKCYAFSRLRRLHRLAIPAKPPADTKNIQPVGDAPGPRGSDAHSKYARVASSRAISAQYPEPHTSKFAWQSVRISNQSLQKPSKNVSSPVS